MDMEDVVAEEIAVMDATAGADMVEEDTMVDMGITVAGTEGTAGVDTAAR